jgi:hypothetical protein
MAPPADLTDMVKSLGARKPYRAGQELEAEVRLLTTRQHSCEENADKGG